MPICRDCPYKKEFMEFIDCLRCEGTPQQKKRWEIELEMLEGMDLMETYGKYNMPLKVELNAIIERLGDLLNFVSDVDEAQEMLEDACNALQSLKKRIARMAEAG
jgi:hypothetical protein